MNRASRTAAFAILLGAAASPMKADEPAKPFAYPDAPQSDTVDVYHGVKVPDPYRPLEDPDSDVTRAWVEAENQVTGAFLGSVPQRDAIRARVTEL